MENRIITAVFKGSKNTKVSDVWQWDYGQTLRIQGLDLPTAVEVDFAVAGASESIARIGTTKDGVTDVVIPDSLIETGKNLVAYIYLRDSASGNTEYQIDMLVTKRAKPEAYDRPEDKKLFGQAIEAVNTAADRAEKAGQTATEAAGQAAEDAQQTAEDRKEVEKMVEIVSDISEQVKKVEQLSQQAQDAADKTEADAQQTAEDRVEVGKMLETVKDVSEQVKSVEESVQKAKESEQAAAGHRTAVEEMKNSVEQTASAFPQKVQEGVQAIENAGASEVQEITQAGTAQKTAVEAAGTQAVESVENVQQVATEAVETAKTEAVQAVQAEGAKQIKEVQDKGAEVLQSIPEDFATQMETKLNKQQGIENKGKVLVIGEDGNVVPGEVASGGGDGIAIINTMSGESPLVIPDSAERVNKRLELGGKTEQVQTGGKNLVNANVYEQGYLTSVNAGDKVSLTQMQKSFTTNMEVSSMQGKNVSVSVRTKGKTGKKYVFADETDTIITGVFDTGNNNYSEFKNITIPKNAKKLFFSVTYDAQENTELQVELGTTVTTYEPYTGGKPSPSPEYQQEIKSVGKWNEEKQKYEVSVKVTGKNLLNLQKESDVNGLYRGWKCGDGEKITLSIKDKNNNADISGCFLGLSQNGDSASGGVLWLVDSGIIKVKEATSTHPYVTIYSTTETTIKKLTERFEIQCERGTVATDYAPYAEQTLTLTSDRPITKWDRLVEQGGQIGWLYGSVIATIDETASISLYTPNGFYVYVKNIDKKEKTGYCDKLYAKKMSNGEPFVLFGNANNNGLYTLNTQEFYGKTVSEIREKLKEYPLNIIGKSETTEFVPLPQSEQNAIRALKTYYPTTVITADGGELDPDIKVTYTADTKNYIDGKVSAKVASILRQYQADTANLLSLMPMETQATMIENDTNNILNNLESEEAHE